MTQAEIADVLEEHYPRYLLVQEIITITGLTRVKVYRNMRSLKKRDEVKKAETPLSKKDDYVAYIIANWDGKSIPKRIKT